VNARGERWLVVVVSRVATVRENGERDNDGYEEADNHRQPGARLGVVIVPKLVSLASLAARVSIADRRHFMPFRCESRNLNTAS
jgi:hypothetical protein